MKVSVRGKVIKFIRPIDNYKVSVRGKVIKFITARPMDNCEGQCQGKGH